MSLGETSFYVAGGTLRHDARSYVERQADKDLLDGLLQGEFCYVLTSRQMGKSSLMVRTAQKLRGQKIDVIALDLTAIGLNLTPEQWYDGLIVRMGGQLRLEDELEEFWRASQRLSPVQRFFSAVREIVMKQRLGPLVIFVDEIDVVRSLPFSTDEFFAAIRECYNRRTEDSEFSRLTFCLLGVATPSDLIRDTRTTPFNIGRRIVLNDFTEKSALPLGQGLGREENAAGALLKRILYWTNGHPYLTQRLCQALAQDSSVTGPAGVDRLCELLFLSNRAREIDDNLLFVRERLLGSEADRASLLSLYEQVRRRGKGVRDDETNPLVSILRLSGIVRVVQGYLWVRNRIYFRVFDRDWVVANMPDAELRRQRTAFRRGVIRTAAVALLIITAFALLSVYALRVAKEEARQRKLADNAKRETQEAYAQVSDTLSRLEMQRVEELFSSGDSSSALAYLARVLRQNPANGVAAARVLSALTQRSFSILLTEPLKHVGAVWSAQFSPDGQRVVTASEDKTARVWDANTGQPLTEPLKHVGQVRSAEFSPDGQRVVTASEDKTARIWDANSGQLLTEPLKHGAAVGSARFSPDGQRVVTASGDKTARVWDVNTGQPLTEQLKHVGRVRSAEFSPDGQRVVTASFDKTARVWDATTGQPLTEPFKYKAKVSSARFSPDGQRVVTANFDNTARIWDANTGQPLTEPLEHEARVSSARFSPDGQRVVTASFDNTARVWDANTGQPLTEPLKHEAGVSSAQFSPDGQRVVTASEDKRALVWDVANANTGRPLTEPFKHGAEVSSARFSPGGQRVVTASGDKTARVWDANTGQPLTEPLKHKAGVSSAQFSPDGQRVVTASGDKTARIWDANTGQPLSEPLKHVAAVYSAEFSPEGQRVVTASLDNTARVWDANTGQPLTEPLKHGAAVVSARFSPDGQRVVTVSSDKTARVWDVPSVSLPVPVWIPKLTQAIAGKRFNDHGLSEPVPFAELLALKRQLTESSASDVWTRWAKWFFADPAGRTISPFSDTTVPDYVQHRIEENTLESLQEAVKVAPTNGLALARLARAILAQEPAKNPRQVGEASWFSLRAIKFGPEQAEAWWARAEAFERVGNLSEALQAMIRALRIQPQNAELWNAQGRMLEKTNRADEAFQSFTKAIEIARANSGSQTEDQAKFYLSRSNYLKRQNRLAEAATDFCLAKNIPPREPQTKPDLIDLSLYYNASLTEKWHTDAPTDLSLLRHGVQTLAGVEFDVRGLIQVGAETPTGEKYPKQVPDIAVGRECKRLHFLHSAINAFNAKDGAQTGSYVVHYADGQQRVIPLVIGQDLADWWSQPNEENKRFTIAWKGTNELNRMEGRTIRLFKTTWENPLPQIPVKSIDFVSTADEAPFLVAITAE